MHAAFEKAIQCMLEIFDCLLPIPDNYLQAMADCPMAATADHASFKLPQPIALLRLAGISSMQPSGPPANALHHAELVPSVA